MNVLIIADDETVLPHVPEVPVDVLISCGDLPDYEILKTAGRCACKRIFAVKGNHDSSGPFSEPIEDLHLKTQAFAGLSFGGFCGSWKYKPRGNYLFEQSEVEEALRNFPRVDVLITHNSPRLVHDRDDDVHTGFMALNAYIDRAKPKFLIHGHQHVNQETMVGNTRVIGVYGYRQMVIAG